LLEVACAEEGDWVPHSAAMLHSLLVHHRDEEVRIHYLHGPDFSSEDGRLLKQMVEAHGGSISFIFIADDVCAGLPTEGFTGKATWYRIFVPEILQNLDRLLFLDLDLIVMDSLLPLWRMDLQGRTVAGVTNIPASPFAKRLIAAGFDLRKYFNAGVVLMDLERMRQDGSTEAMRSYGISHSDRLVMREQDALNAVLAKRRLALHPRWNCMNSFFSFPWSHLSFAPDAIEEARANPAVRHFEGPNKPWHYLGDHDSFLLYMHHRQQTPWPEFDIEGVTPINVVRRTKLFRRVRRWRRGRPDVPSGSASGSGR
jgi:lipopolysaccharide biosynthesis glycosyltransferase